MNTTLGAQLVGFPTLGAQTWESFVDAAWFPGLRVQSRECVHVAWFPGFRHRFLGIFYARVSAPFPRIFGGFPGMTRYQDCTSRGF